MAERYPIFARVVDWGAVIAGFVVAFAIGILLSLVAAITGATISTVVAFIISFVSLVVGGWLAGYLAPANGLMHGILVAVLSIIVTFVLLVSIAGPGLFLPGIPTGLADTATLLIGFVIQLIAGAIGGYLGDLTAGRPALRT